MGIGLSPLPYFATHLYTVVLENNNEYLTQPSEGRLPLPGRPLLERFLPAYCRRDRRGVRGSISARSVHPSVLPGWGRDGLAARYTPDSSTHGQPSQPPWLGGVARGPAGDSYGASRNYR